MFTSRTADSYDPTPRVNLDEHGNEKPGTRHARYADCSALCVERPRPEFEPTRDPQPWSDPFHEPARWSSAEMPVEHRHLYNWAPRDRNRNGILITFRDDAEQSVGKPNGQEVETLATLAAFYLNHWGENEGEEYGTPAYEHARRVLTLLVAVSS